MKKPNILFIMTDQWRFDSIGVNGSKICKTPNIDNLAKGGVNFTNAFTTTSLCSPARAALMTGLYPHNTGILNNTHERDAVHTELPEDTVTFAHKLTESGYNTDYIGKWHVGIKHFPKEWGFSGQEGCEDNREAWWEHRKKFTDSKDGEVSGKALMQKVMLGRGERPLVGVDPSPLEGTLTYLLADYGVKHLEKLSKSSKPFCLFLSFPGPHYPCIIPEPYASMYDPKKIPQWPNFKDNFKNKTFVNKKKMFQWGVEKYTWKQWQHYLAFYWGFCSMLDDQIGRVLGKLKELGLEEDTIVIFTADHGDMAGSHRQFNKSLLMYDETYHIPLVIRWPEKAKKGLKGTNKNFISISDLMPTLVEMGGAEIPKKIDGRSIVPLLEGKAPKDWPQEVFCEQHGDELGLYSQRMVRNSKYKYIYNVQDKDELYDLVKDPHELKNVVDDPKYKKILLKTEKKLLDWMRKSEDTIAQWAGSVLGGRK